MWNHNNKNKLFLTYRYFDLRNGVSNCFFFISMKNINKTAKYIK